MSSLLSSIEDVCPLESRRSSRRSKRHLAGWRPSHGRKPCILTGDLVEHHAPSWPRHANRSRVSVVSHAKHSQTSGPFYLRNKSKPTKTTLASLTMETACGEISMCQHVPASFSSQPNSVDLGIPEYTHARSHENGLGCSQYWTGSDREIFSPHTLMHVISGA
jgi:hypothetical protein